jgi:hypothetical protein
LKELSILKNTQKCFIDVPDYFLVPAVGEKTFSIIIFFYKIIKKQVTAKSYRILLLMAGKGGVLLCGGWLP